MKTRRTPQLGSASVDDMLDHMKRARLARLAMQASGLSVSDVALRTGLAFQTVQRFCGLDPDSKRNTRWPRLRTAVMILRELGWEVSLNHASSAFSNVTVKLHTRKPTRGNRKAINLAVSPA